MKNNITLNINHSQKTRVESFLNNVDENLEQIPFDAQELSHLDDIIGGFKFKEKGQSTFVIVIFATSYFHANDIQTANSLTRPNIKWTINGDILFGVESIDERTSSEMLSFFAGRE
jgi:hypothetical protein